MKAGLTSSVALHAVAVALAVVSFSSPKAFDVQDSESFPVDIVPIESLTQIQQGEKTAPMKEKSAPVPTTKPQGQADRGSGRAKGAAGAGEKARTEAGA